MSHFTDKDVFMHSIIVFTVFPAVCSSSLIFFLNFSECLYNPAGAAGLTRIWALISVSRESKSDWFCSLNAGTELIVHLVVGPSLLPAEEKRRYINRGDLAFVSCGFFKESGDFKESLLYRLQIVRCVRTFCAST